MNSLIEILNVRGAQFLRFAWPMLWQSGLLIALLFALDFALRKRVRATVRYALWMLVVVKLVLPASLSLPTGVGYWVPAPESVAMEEAMAPPILMNYQNPRPAAPPAATRLPQRVAVVPRAVPLPALTWPGIVAATWFCCVVVLTMIFLLRAAQARRIAARASATDDFFELLFACARKMRVRPGVSLRLSDAVNTPAVCGVFRPVILLPRALAGKLDAPHIRAVLLHELAHLRRGDLWLGHLQTALQIFYFYNPLLWLANAAIRRAREEAVDELVLVAMADEAAVYPETLLNVAKFTLQAPRLAFGFAGILEGKSTLGGRIRLMLQRPWPTTAKLGIPAALALLILALVLLPMGYAGKMPSYQGKTAEQWLGQVSYPPDMASKGFSEILQAFVQMDGRGVTFLRKQLAAGSRAQAEMGAIPAEARRAARQSTEMQTVMQNQARAALVLRELGPAAEPAIPELIAMLPEQTGVAVQEAAWTLEAFGPKARAAVPLLLDVLTVNSDAAGLLIKLDPHNPKLVSALVEALNNPNALPRVTSAAAAALAKIDPDNPALVPALIKALDSPGAQSAADVLTQLGPRAKAAVPALRAALEHAKEEMAASNLGPTFAIPYAEALQALAPDQPDVLAEANAILHPPPPSASDIEALVAKVEQAQAAVDEVRDTNIPIGFRMSRMDDNNYDLALMFLDDGIKKAQAAGSPVPDTLVKKRILPLLQKALQSSNVEVLAQACRLSSSLGPVAAQVSDPLIKERVVPLLMQKLDLSETVRVLQATCGTLTTLGSNASPALPKLMALLEKEDPSEYRQNERGCEMMAIIGIAPGDPATLPSLIHGLDDAHMRGEVIYGLGKFGPEAADAVPGLHKCLQSSDMPGMKFNAALALWRIAKEPPSPVILKPAISMDAAGPVSRDSGESYFSLHTLEMLGGLNAQTDETKSIIRQLAQSSSAEVRTNALALLEKIGEKKSAP